MKSGKKKGLRADDRALSPVVASIILCAVVLMIGLSTWSYTNSVSAFLRTSYYEDVKKQIDAVSERFMVAHVAYNSSTHVLHVWVHNYGKVAVDADVYVMGDAEGKNFSETATPIPYETILEIMVPLRGGSLPVGSELVVEVVSRRGNVVYETYVVPVE